jgi:hypothetical protein
MIAFDRVPGMNAGDVIPRGYCASGYPQSNRVFHPAEDGLAEEVHEENEEKEKEPQSDQGLARILDGSSCGFCAAARADVRAALIWFPHSRYIFRGIDGFPLSVVYGLYHADRCDTCSHALPRRVL